MDEKKYDYSYSATTHEPTILRLAMSYNPIVAATFNRGVGIKTLKYGGVERAPFLGVHGSHIPCAFNECSKVN